MRLPFRALRLASCVCLLLAHPLILRADTGPIEDEELVENACQCALPQADFSGKGRYQLPNGDLYEGEFENGAFHGTGRWTGSDVTYRGEFKQGKYEGQGELIHKDGRKYRGGFERGQYHGKGRYENRAGEVYEGDFQHNEFTGTGSFSQSDGTRYEGEFLNWRPHGTGSFTDANGNLYQGQFVNGALTGQGKMLTKDGTSYEGGFKQWAYHGEGIFRYPNGDEYKGSFANGMYDGQGTLRYAAVQKDGRSSDSGFWRNGRLENKDEERQVKLNVETALYRQRALLDQALSGLAPSQPGKISMYLLAVAGDGAQEVFRREVEFVRAQFDREFGTQGRSLALINSRSTVDSAPMATQTSIRESLKAIAARMNKEQDILFLFLTSHGSKDHEFTLDQNGMELRNLPAKELGAALKETGIRWKVVVVSACYSGGFIDSIKDEHTLVITAARHDRTSFGCADDNDFTYFGRAFFKEALPHSASFQDAFQKAKQLVEQWEAEDIKAGTKEDEIEHSLPQMHNPAGIRRHLQRWRAQLGSGARQAAMADTAGLAAAKKRN